MSARHRHVKAAKRMANAIADYRMQIPTGVYCCKPKCDMYYTADQLRMMADETDVRNGVEPQSPVYAALKKDFA